MKKFYLIFAMFFGLTFNLSAQETVIAVWDFADNSLAGEIHPDFSSAANPDMTYMSGGHSNSATNAFTNDDVTGGDFDMSYTMTNSSANTGLWSNYILNHLDLGPTTGSPTAGSGLVNNKIHFSLSFKSITIEPGSGDKITFILKDANNGNGAAGGTNEGDGTNHRLTGLQLLQNGTNSNIRANVTVYNNGNANGTSKMCGHFGNTQGMTLTDITIGVTVDYSAGSVRFWIDSPDTYMNDSGGMVANSAWGFKMYNTDGYVNTSGFPMLTGTPTGAGATALANSVVQMLQFSPVLSGNSEFVFDQIKISTGEYENTVAAGNTSTAPTSALMLQGILDIDGGNKKAVHVRAIEDIADLSIYKLQVYSNANTDAGASHTLSGSASAGDDILIANDGDALGSYMSASTIFDSVVNTGSWPSINGDDSIELLMNDTSVEVFGSIGTDGTGEAWEYTDSWAYKVEGAWTYGGVNCTDGSTTTWDSDCVYPLAVGQQPVAYDVTFSVDMSNETVGATGVFLGGGIFSSANAHQMLDDDGDGVYSVTVSLNEGTSGNYIFLNGPTSASDWGTKEDLAGQSCGDPDNFNDRTLASVSEDTSILYCFGTCEATCPVDPCADVVGAPAIADDFDGNATDILEYFDDALTTTVVDGASLGASGNVLQYVDDGTGYYANVQVRTCNKFDMALTNYFTLDVYLDSSTITGTSPNQVQFKLQNGDLGAPWETQVVATATVDALDTWQTLVFDFNLIAGALDRTDIDNVVIQVNGEANNDPVTAYIDNLTSAAGAPAANYNVTFEVDANNIIVGDRGMYVGGGVLGGADAHAMSDDDGDGVWSVTLELPTGTTGNYIFLNAPGDGGDWGRKEDLTGQACADGQFNDRLLAPVDADTTLSFCFGSCDTSCTAVTRYDVTFEVGMANETVTGGVYLAGGIFGGSNAIQLFDDDGDGIYTKVVSIPENTTGHYAFTNSPANHYDWATKENLAGLECGDASNFDDRQIGPITANTTLSFCFGSCEAASACAFGPCDSAIALTPGTTQSGNTSDFGDLFDDSVCLGPNYDNGDDALYVYTATEDGETLEVVVSGVGTYTGVAITQGCPTGGTEICFGSATNSWSGGDMTVTSDPLVAGEDYYVHISTWPSPQSTDYVLNATVTEAPSCLAPTALAIADITSSGASLSWTAGATETQWEYQVVESGATPAETGTVTSDNPLALSGLMSNSSYDVYLRAVCSADDSSEWVSISFTTAIEAPGCGDTFSYNYPTGSSGGYQYDLNFTAPNADDLLFTSTVDTAGDWLTLSVTGSTESGYDWVYVTNGAGTVLLAPVSGAMDYEAVSEDGTVNVYLASDSSVTSGPVIFTVSCAPEPLCYEPSDLVVSSITDTTASLSWTAGGTETQWEYQIVESGVTPAETGTITTDGAVDFTGLTGNTSYDVYLRANCDSGDNSDWASVTFTTIPSPLVPDYLNDFTVYPGEFWTEGDGAYADGPDSSGFSSWAQDGFANDGSTGAARMNIYSTFPQEWLISPNFDLSGGTYNLTVDAAATEYASTTDAIWGEDDFAALMVTVDGGTTWTELYRWDATNNPGAAGATMPAIELSGYDGITQFAFYAESTASNEDIDFFIDNFSIAAPAVYDVTFSVDMSNETVSANGVFVGGGFLGSATEHQLFDDDGDGIYSVTIPLEEGSAGNYIFLNGPANDGDWGAKEDLAGQDCADAANFNDRYLDPITGDTTILFCFGECTAECPSDPCEGVEGAPAIADDFDGNSVDILEWVGDNDVTYSIVDGTSIGATSSVLEYVDPGSGFYANLQLRTCNKFDMSATNVFTMDVYIDGASVTGSSPNQIAFKLQNNDLGGNAWTTQIELVVPINAVDTWQTVEFDFTGTDAMTRDDIDQVVIQFNSEANNDAVTAYIDNLQSSQSLGLDDPAMSEFTYFPNPVNDQLTINSQRDVKDITVYNMLGQVVVRQTPNMRNCTVDMSSMQTGAYFVQVSIGNTVETVRVLKK